MKYLELSSGGVAKVSDEDYEMLLVYTWGPHLTKRNGNVYASTTIGYTCPVLTIRRRRRLYMHRIITDCPSAFIVDHWDRDTLNNQRYNLRVTTVQMNSGNHDAHLNSIVGFRGVSMSRGKFRARICKEDKDVHLGLFATAEEAARAYDTAAREIYGPFAWQNINEARDAALADEEILRRDLETIPF